MLRVSLALVAVALLVLNGVVHGLWSHRWASVSEPLVQAAGDRLRDVPLKVGNWDGQHITTDAATLPEELVGRNVSIQYVHRVTGDVVVVYLASGHMSTMKGHTPLQCYPASGYRVAVTEARVYPAPGAGAAPAGGTPDGGTPPEFWAATFSQDEGPAPVHLRVFWSWNDGARWQAPDNLGRTFRASPYLYKCYAIRRVVTPDEPLEGDLAAELLKELLPRLDQVLLVAE
jgi:hypothetical protein